MRAHGGEDFIGEGGAEHGAQGGRELGFAELIVAAEQDDHRARARLKDERLDLALGGHSVGGGGQVVDGGDARGGEFFGGRAGIGAGGGEQGAAAGGNVEHGGVPAGGAGGEVVLAGLGGEDEGAGLAAEDAGGGLCLKGLEAAAGKDARAGVRDPAGALFGGGLGGVKSPGVQGQGFAGPEQAGAGAGLVAELGLDLVERAGQLAVGGNLRGGQGGGGFLGSGAEEELAPGMVADFEPGFLEGVGAAALTPEFGLMERGQEDFVGARALEFLAQKRFDLAHDPQAQGEQGVKARSGFADQSGAQKEFVGEAPGVGGGLFEGGDEGERPVHGGVLCGARRMEAGRRRGGYLTELMSGARPWMRTSRRSPDLMGPMPLGVPVRMTSPGTRVMFVEMKLTSL